MIYLVSNTLESPNPDIIKKLTVEESLEKIRGWPVIQFDTETTGLNPHICKLTSMQFGYKHFDTGEHT